MRGNSTEIFLKRKGLKGGLEGDQGLGVCGSEKNREINSRLYEPTPSERGKGENCEVPKEKSIARKRILFGRKS